MVHTLRFFLWPSIDVPCATSNVYWPVVVRQMQFTAVWFNVSTQFCRFTECIVRVNARVSAHSRDSRYLLGIRQFFISAQFMWSIIFNATIGKAHYIDSPTPHTHIHTPLSCRPYLFASDSTVAIYNVR